MPNKLILGYDAFVALKNHPQFLERVTGSGSTPNPALLSYAPDTPMIDEPSAGYIFTWDMLGNGQWIATDQFEGEEGTHTEFVEALLSTDMKKTCDDLAVFLKNCVR